MKRIAQNAPKGGEGMELMRFISQLPPIVKRIAPSETNAG
jgi:hypothetical protein